MKELGEQRLHAKGKQRRILEKQETNADSKRP